MRSRGIALRWGSSLATSALFVTLLALVGPGAPVEAPTIPSAGTTYLCSGYSGCRSDGYSDAGYGAVSSRMYWRMYSGHNCTNYVAYRMIKAGMSTERPWSGGGNASEWGLHMDHITDQVPNVGAVAWWARYDNGSGSAGHVAYVERVVSATEIIISEDSWGGTFHWRRITKASGRWPTGFIHFIDKQLKYTAAPKVSGEPTVGQLLTVNPGTWTPTTKKTYQWLANGVAIAGATASAYRPTLDDLGKKVQVRVTASRVLYDPVTVTTAATAPVEKDTFVAGDPPVLTGSAWAGEMLTATTGGWTPADARFEWRWYADNVRIRGNGGPRLLLTPAHVGKTIKVVVVARKEGFENATAPAVAALGPVLIGQIEMQRDFVVYGRARVGSPLSVRPGTWTPADAQVAYQWLRGGTPIPGATATTYRLTPADAGARISVQTTLTRQNYAPLVEAHAHPDPVIAMPTLHVTATGKSRKAVVRVRVTAPGVSPVNGRVRIGVGRHAAEAQLVNGVVQLVLGPLEAGRRDVSVYYGGSSIVPAKRYAGTVVVQP